MEKSLDLNADLGEGGTSDADILACVSSVNIACGGHAGDEASMRACVRAAKQLGVAIGAHPSFVDRENFGRTEMHVPAAELCTQLCAQIQSLRTICAEEGAQLVHVKPHGALYNQAARDAQLATVVVEAIAQVDPRLRVVGLADSALLTAARDAGLAYAAEGFADRRYHADGRLVARSQAHACIDDIATAIAQTMQMVQSACITSLEGEPVHIQIDTVCLHGDGVHALELAQRLRRELIAAGIQIRAL